MCGSSATFYGKVSFPPLCPHRLPDTDGACSVCVCVCGGVLCVWRTDAAGFREQHRKRLGSDSVGASMVKAGGSSKPASVRLPVWTGFNFPSWCRGVLTSSF